MYYNKRLKRIKSNIMTTPSVLYKIDGGIDFYKELLESGVNSDADADTVASAQPKHTETLYQKTNPSFVKNVYNVPIGKDKLKCPYCRTVHVGALLPYIVNEKRVSGVNAPAKLCMPTPFKCQHVSVSATQKRRTPCRSFVNVYCIPATDTGDPVFLCKRHLTLTRAKQLQ